MQLLDWESRFSVGVREFDQHHKILFEMINSLIIAREDNRGPEVIRSTLEQLHFYTIFHFSAEESMMEYFNYEGLEDQKAEHQKLLVEVEALRSRLEHEDNIPIDEVLEFVAGWLLDHTLGMDMLYGPFLRHHVD